MKRYILRRPGATYEVTYGSPSKIETSDTPKADPVGPDDPAHRSVRETIDHIAAGSVVPVARQALRKALDKADAPPTGRAKSDQALGRAIRFGDWSLT